MTNSSGACGVPRCLDFLVGASGTAEDRPLPPVDRELVDVSPAIWMHSLHHHAGPARATCILRPTSEHLEDDNARHHVVPGSGSAIGVAQGRRGSRAEGSGAGGRGSCPGGPATRRETPQRTTRFLHRASHWPCRLLPHAPLDVNPPATGQRSDTRVGSCLYALARCFSVKKPHAHAEALVAVDRRRCRCARPSGTPSEPQAQGVLIFGGSKARRRRPRGLRACSLR